MKAPACACISHLSHRLEYLRSVHRSMILLQAGRAQSKQEPVPW